MRPKLSIAPMMQRTDRHFRYFLRKITRHTLLYTEMVTTGAVLHGNKPRLLDFSEEEHPISLQLGGDDVGALTRCAQIAEQWGYDEVNINVGCPSERVKKGNFGVCLMAQPDRVADAVHAMQAAVGIPVTVKHRIGFDDLDRYEDMARFVERVSQAGCRHFTVHARKAWLYGLNPKENRTVPPLRYEDVYRLKRDFPHLCVELNGGVRSIEDACDHLSRVDAVMIGRAAFETPYLFSTVDNLVFADETRPLTRHELVEQMVDYVDDQLVRGTRLLSLIKPMLTLFYAQPGARAWKRHLSTYASKEGADTTVLLAALARVPRERPLHAGVGASEVSLDAP